MKKDLSKLDFSKEPLKNVVSSRNFHISSEKCEFARQAYQGTIRQGAMSALQPKCENCSSKHVFQRFPKLNGLVPAIVQDADTLQVLMLGFMNGEALEKTLSGGRVTFFSRSKNRLWQKGETSGNFLKVVEVKTDCDNDSLLILAKPQGSTCHTGSQSCFGKSEFDLLQLFKLIKERKEKMPENSYTSSLFRDGLDKIIAKIEEEAEEVVLAAKSEGKQRLIEESCDLLYHLFVLLNNENVTIADVQEELRKRHK